MFTAGFDRPTLQLTDKQMQCPAVDSEAAGETCPWASPVLLLLISQKKKKNVRHAIDVSRADKNPNTVKAEDWGANFQQMQWVQCLAQGHESSGCNLSVSLFIFLLKECPDL